MLINLRNALMAGTRLPYDAEVEYLESTGTQYIETPYTVNTAADKIRVIFQGLETANYKWFFGIYDNSGAIRLASGSGDMANRRTVAYGSNTNYVADSITYNRPHELVADSNGLSIDGTSQFSFASFASTSKFCLFTFGRDGTPASTVAGKVRIFAFQHWRNGVLISDYIPVRKGTVGYLYDRVSGKLFGNAGTGDFVLGPDVVPVEYIESHAAEYIDTGVYGSQNLRTTFDYQLVYSGTAPVAKGLFGYYSSGAKYHLYCSGAVPTFFQVGMGNAYTNTLYVDNVRHSIEFNNSAVSSDGNVVATFGPYEYPTGRTLLLFALQNASGGLYSMTPMRKWRVQMWDNGTPVRDYVPVRVGTGTTWEGAMMDTLTRRIYRNAGTGAFGYGNDLKYPIPAE